MVNLTGANAATSIAKRLSGLTVALGAGAAMVAGLAAPANASAGTPTATPAVIAPAAHTAAATVLTLGVPVAPVQAKPIVTQPAPVKPAASKPTAAKPVVKPVAKPVAKAPAKPTVAQLMPHGTPHHGQAAFAPNATEMANAKAIVKAGQEMKLPPRAWVIAVATSMQESKLQNLGNLGHRNDHDSLGLFQQRPSSGWGSPSQCTNPDHAAKKFYGALEHVHNYQNLPLTTAAQKVQVSAFPSAYAKWESAAAKVVAATFNTPSAS